MTYTVKEKNKLFYLYNTNTRRMLTKGYNSVIEAKGAVDGANRRGQGARKYHACCRKAGCGKKGKKATSKKLTKSRKKATPKLLPSKKLSKKATPKKLTKSTKSRKKATPMKLPKMHTAGKATPKSLPVKKKKKRRVALTQVVNNSGSGNIKLIKNSGQRKAYKYFPSDEFEKKARWMDRDIKDIAF